jgi:hypothetical protein
MSSDKFGRTPEHAKSDQRAFLERARDAYPESVHTQEEYVKGSAKMHDLHLLSDRGLIDRVPNRFAQVPVGAEDFVAMYKLNASGHDALGRPGWLDREFPRVLNVTAFGSSVNINSPNATASTQVSVKILQDLRQEIERAPIAPEEKAGLLAAIDKLLRHPAILAILAKLPGLG